MLHAFINTGGNAAWQYALGPMNLVFGIAFGLALGAMISITSVWHNGVKRTVILFFSSLLLIYVSDAQGVLGAGAIGNITMGLTTRHLWQRGWPRRLISEEHREDVRARAAAYIEESLGALSQAWYLLFYPLLFGLIGASLNFRAVDPTIAGKAVTYAVLAVTIRILAATGVALNFRTFSIRERLFMGLAWISKATTQGEAARAGPFSQLPRLV
jgi:Kef-type K+ transport system membrane component KefB